MSISDIYLLLLYLLTLDIPFCNGREIFYLASAPYHIIFQMDSYIPTFISRGKGRK